MSDDYIAGLRQDLVAAAARQQHAGRAARVARPLHPRVWSPAAALGVAVALAALLVVVVSLRTVGPAPRPADAQIAATVHIGGHPRDAVAVGGRLVVADYDGRILELRGPGTVRVVGRSEGTPVSLAAAGDAVWVVSVDGGRGGPPRSRLIRLDTRTGRVLGRVRVRGVGDAVAAGAVGVSLPAFVRIGPALAKDPGRLTSPASEELVVGERSVWMRSGDSVLELDAAGRVVNQVGGISPTLASIGSERSVLPDTGGAWVAGQAGGLLYRIESGRVTRRVKVGGRTAGVLARMGSTVWVSATSSAGQFQLVGVDAETGKVTGRVRLGRKAPQAIVPVGKRLWVITSGGDAIVVNPA